MGLSERLFKFLDHRIKSLSGALQNELNYCIMSPNILQHEFFYQIDRHMPVILHILCSEMSNKTYAQEEVVFTGGSVAKKTFFVSAGKLIYNPIHGKSTPVPLKKCISEATLWIYWRHQGELQSVKTSELFELSSGNFQQTMQMHPKPYYFAVSYAHEFLNHMKLAEHGHDLIHDEFRRISLKKICASLP